MLKIFMYINLFKGKISSFMHFALYLPCYGFQNGAILFVSIKIFHETCADLAKYYNSCKYCILGHIGIDMSKAHSKQ